MRHLMLHTAAVFAVALLAAGCSRSPSPTPAPRAGAPLEVADITVGRSLNPDKTIADKSSSFAPEDVLYVSVKTDGATPGAMLMARWTYEDGQPVSESSQTIAPSGAAVHEFHASKPDGWPVGEYKVEVLLNGISAGSRSFEVE